MAIPKGVALSPLPPALLRALLLLLLLVSEMSPVARSGRHLRRRRLVDRTFVMFVDVASRRWSP